MSILGGSIAGVDRLRARPSLFVAGVGSALATTLAFLASLGWAIGLDVLGVSDPWIGVVTTVLAYDVVLVVTKPAVLPGIYDAVRAPESENGVRNVCRTMATSARHHYRGLLATMVRSRIAGWGFALLLAPIVIAVALVLVTGVSLVGYTVGAVQTPKPILFLFGVLGVFLAIRLAGTIPVTFAELFAVDGTPPSPAWRASVGLVRDDPRTLAVAGLERAFLGSLPFAVAFAALYLTPGEDVRALVVPLAVVLVLGTVGKTVEAVALVTRLESIESGPPSSDAGRRHAPRTQGERWRPSRRTVVAVVLILALAAGSSAVRITDVRPDADSVPQPTADTADAAELYAVARERSVDSSRNVTLSSWTGNWSESDRRRAIRVRLTVDYQSREMVAVAWIGENGTWAPRAISYASDGLYARGGMGGHPTHVFAEWTVGQWRLYASPYYVYNVRSLPVRSLPPATATWDERVVENDTIVLSMSDPGAVADAVSRYTSDSIEYREGSVVRVRIDRESQRITQVTIRERFVEYESDERAVVYSRLDNYETIRYEYEGVSVEQPDGIGFQPAGLVWDLLYY